MKYTHESEELNALLGKKVKVTLFDDTTITGILTRKTHVKKIEVVKWNQF